jgi:prevent-host-death family protein
MKVSEFRSHLNEAVTSVYYQDTRIVLEKSGIPVAAVVSIDDLRQLQRSEQARLERENAFAVLDEIHEAVKEIPAEELWREGAKALAEVRAEVYGDPVNDVDEYSDAMK